jgi:hypothetical protein
MNVTLGQKTTSVQDDLHHPFLKTNTAARLRGRGRGSLPFGLRSHAGGGAVEVADHHSQSHQLVRLGGSANAGGASGAILARDVTFAACRAAHPRSGRSISYDSLAAGGGGFPAVKNLGFLTGRLSLRRPRWLRRRTASRWRSVRGYPGPRRHFCRLLSLAHPRSARMPHWFTGEDMLEFGGVPRSLFGRHRSSFSARRCDPRAVQE